MWLRKNGRKKEKKKKKETQKKEKRKRGVVLVRRQKISFPHVYINPIKKLKRMLCWWF